MSSVIFPILVSFFYPVCSEPYLPVEIFVIDWIYVITTQHNRTGINKYRIDPVVGLGEIDIVPGGDFSDRTVSSGVELLRR